MSLFYRRKAAETAKNEAFLPVFWRQGGKICSLELEGRIDDLAGNPAAILLSST